MTASGENLSNDHQPEGSAGKPSDTLDRDAGQATRGAHRPGDDTAGAVDSQNAAVRRGGEAQGGIAPEPGDPTSPAAAAARARDRDEAMQAGGFGDDGSRSTYKS